jgi:undecaprenyl-diphosphatase
VFKVPELFGPLGDGIHGQVLAGSLAAFLAAYLAVRFLTTYFETRTLTPSPSTASSSAAGASPGSHCANPLHQCANDKPSAGQRS